MRWALPGRGGSEPSSSSSRIRASAFFTVSSRARPCSPSSSSARFCVAPRESGPATGDTWGRMKLTRAQETRAAPYRGTRVEQKLCGHQAGGEIVLDQRSGC
ncbi:hypothetical protein CK820_G0036223 [Pan troglodytes]|uniref:Uncharacterized protein n=1 Tax=Pan troglodytes TaxID=9598 RepID=A0A2J8KTK1_PANTR|nr:hypothetical protein CK820_G0036223 [Pan troglodytes]